MKSKYLIVIISGILGAILATAFSIGIEILIDMYFWIAFTVIAGLIVGFSIKLSVLFTKLKDKTAVKIISVLSGLLVILLLQLVYYNFILEDQLKSEMINYPNVTMEQLNQYLEYYSFPESVMDYYAEHSILAYLELILLPLMSMKVALSAFEVKL